MPPIRPGALNVSSLTGQELVDVVTSGPQAAQCTTAQLAGAIPASKFTTAALVAGNVPAASIAGADFVVWQNTGAVPGNQTLPSAAALLAAIPGATWGTAALPLSFILRIVNTGAGTLTLVQDAGATITLIGTMTVAQNVFRDYNVSFQSATTATIQSIGSGTSP